MSGYLFSRGGEIHRLGRSHRISLLKERGGWTAFIMSVCLFSRGGKSTGRTENGDSTDWAALIVFHSKREARVDSLDHVSVPFF